MKLNIELPEHTRIKFFYNKEFENGKCRFYDTYALIYDPDTMKTLSSGYAYLNPLKDRPNKIVGRNKAAGRALQEYQQRYPNGHLSVPQDKWHKDTSWQARSSNE